MAWGELDVYFMGRAPWVPELPERADKKVFRVVGENACRDAVGGYIFVFECYLGDLSGGQCFSGGKVFA